MNKLVEIHEVHKFDIHICLSIKLTSPIHSTSLEMSKVSLETAILLISVAQQTDAAII